MNKLILVFGFLIVTSVVYAQKPLFSDNGPNEPVKLDANAARADFMPGVILVRFKDSVKITQENLEGLKKTGIPSVDAIFREFEVTSVSQVFKGVKPLSQKQMLRAFNGYTFERPNLHNIYELTVKDPSKQFDLIKALKNDSSVIYAEPDYIYSIVEDKPESEVITPDGIREYLGKHGAPPLSSAKSFSTEERFDKVIYQAKAISPSSISGGALSSNVNPGSPSSVSPNDPLYSQQWAIPAVHADAVWDTTTGDSSQIIAFLDTGVDWHHPDLAANIWTNTAEANGVPGVDDDHDGYVDDIHGWDFVNNDNDPSDDNSHGTHVAGIACAVGNNGIGIAGVNWHARIMPIKVFQSSGRGDAAMITRGIYYAVQKGATVINMSFGSYARSLTMEAALQYAYAQCVLV
ncbi:MAG: S8 family serine peptidase, partial [Candidatus Kryptoniota bacterium]